ncbi:hypothetical protein [Tengunoibacter tsumagoiensis]|uniref:Glycoside hydrolase family 42 N-terminal domain-containing protein n=1 Tax=Tengunoibacter tsumagoiensis TaxID=2014871 RepID=A0A402A353_9CHLR|nr:hypothetical protein [Tengunoibacter tsumagoiensis]GCE13475.1 hypothetical protein KTT_33340 [Tengunoibacter tsumagoiensis]
MDITVAYFHPLFHPETVKRDFEQIRAVGATSIVYALHEQEEQRWPYDLERGLRLAQDAGLKVSLSLGRFGNLFAGPIFMPSWYTFRHPQSLVKDRHGRDHDMSCFNHEDFRSWLFKEIEYYLSAYPIQGILIDEPRVPDVTCFCSVCRALCPDITDLQNFRQRSMLSFFSELFNCVKRVKPQAKTSLVLLPQDLALAEDLSTVPALDSIGCHLFWQLLQEDVSQVEAWSKLLVKQMKASGKKSQLWLQNFNLTAESEPDMETAFTGLMAADPDEVACYYFWRNNQEPERVWQSTRTLLRRIPRRQLYWKSTQPRIPVPIIEDSEEKKVN